MAARSSPPKTQAKSAAKWRARSTAQQAESYKRRRSHDFALSSSNITDRPGREFHARGSRRKGAEAFKQRIESAISSGLFRRIDAEVALQVLWGAVHGVLALILTVEGYPFAARTRLIDAAIENAIRGILRPTRIASS